jgi:drug/metabolite transporter (DMT)-like permease
VGNGIIALALLFAVFLWGGNNTGTKFVVGAWPPVWTGASRFLCAGLLLLLLLRYTHWLGGRQALDRALSRSLWWRGGLSLAAYIVVFNSALRFVPVSHVAVYLGAAPIWALLWEGLPGRNWSSVRRYGAAVLALSGVVVLFWPALNRSGGSWFGELLGLLASVLWTNYGRQCRALGARLSGAETSAHTMWRAGVLLVPFSIPELARSGLAWRTDVALVQLYCIIAGGVVAFAIWNQALRYWPASQVLLFNNLIPLSTMTWAWFWLREPITPTFWVAMFLVITGVLIGQTNWDRILGSRPVPPE